MKLICLGSWVYARNKSTGATTRLWPDGMPTGPKPPHIALVGGFCEGLLELRDLHDALVTAGFEVAYRDANLEGISVPVHDAVQNYPALLLVHAGAAVRVWPWLQAGDLDAANFTQAVFDQAIADYQAAKAAQAQAEEDARTEDTTQQTAARAILAKIEADTVTTDELKQAVGVLIKRELRRSRKE